MNENLIDIILCVYKENDNLKDTIESVLKQSYRSFKLVLVDDGSKSVAIRNTFSLFKSLDKRVVTKYYQNNIGLTKCLHEEVNNSEAKYIGRIDVGDIWLANKLEKQIRLLQEYRNLMVVGTQCVYISEGGDKIGVSNFEYTDSGIRKNIILGNGIFEHSSIVFRNIINYRPEFKYSQDLDLYLRASQIGTLASINEYLTISKVKTKGITISKKPLQRKYQKLAYKSYKAELQNRNYKLYIIKESMVENLLWSWAKIFWIAHIQIRLNNRKSYFWILPFMVSLLIFPPLLRDYVIRFLLNLKSKFNCDN